MVEGKFHLPAEVVLSDSEVAVVDWYKGDKKQFQDLCSVLRPGSEENTKGIQTDEFPTEKDVQRKLNESKVLVCAEKNSGRFLAGFLFFRSPLARSTRPIHSGGFVLVNPSYRGQNLALKVLILMAFIAIDEGYTGLYGRVAMTARSIVPSRRAGAKYYGIIPDSLKVLGRDEWVDDLVCASDLQVFPHYEEIYQVSHTAGLFLSKLWWNEQRKRIHSCRLPPLCRIRKTRFFCAAGMNVHCGKDIIFVSTQKWLDRTSSLVIPPLNMSEERRSQADSSTRIWDAVLHAKGLTPLYVATPNAEQIVQMEAMIRSDAEAGNSFAIDEFTEDGFFNRQLLRTSQDLVVTKEPNGEVLAAAVFGSSAIPRRGSPLGGGYVIVKAEHRNQGIGSSLLDFVCHEMERQGFKGFITDVFPHCGHFLDMALKHGFCVTGSMPKVGYVRGQGLTHSLIVYKNFTSVGIQLPPKLWNICLVKIKTGFVFGSDVQIGSLATAECAHTEIMPSSRVAALFFGIDSFFRVVHSFVFFSTKQIFS